MSRHLSRLRRVPVLRPGFRPALPGRPDRARRSAVLAEARAAVPGIPRDADAEALLRAARRLARAAAKDEFAREGVPALPLPAGWGRSELRRADLAGDAAFHAFVEEVTTALVLGPVVLDAEDVRELRTSPGAADAFGPTLETTGELVSHLLVLAHRLRAEEGGEASASATGDGAGTGAEEPDLEEFVRREAAVVREDVRATLVRLVRTPLEMQVAQARHAVVAEGGSDPLGAVPGGGRDATDRAAGSPAGADRAGGSRTDAGPEPASTAGGAESGEPAPGGSRGAGPSPLRDPVDAAFAFARSENGRRALEFARSENGRRAFAQARSGAEYLYRVYQERSGSSRGGARSGRSGSDGRRR